MKLNKTQELKYDIYSTLHKCPWYRRWFPKDINSDENTIELRPKFIIRGVPGLIGNFHTMQCNKCGKIYDITDYDLW